MSSILIVEDDSELRGVLYELFSENYLCHTASSAEQALKRLSETDYRVVLTDISMPGMSGLELLGHLRQSKPGTAVIMISGIRDHEYAEGLLRMGASDYLVKPFPLEEVEESVAKVLASDAAASPAPAEARADAEAEDDDLGDENAAVFSSVQLGKVFTLFELMEIIQRGKMSGYIELHWDLKTIAKARRTGRFNGPDGRLDEAVENCAGWIYLRDGLMIDAVIDEPETSPRWRSPEQALALLVRLSTIVETGVRVWGFSMSRVSREAAFSVTDNGGKMLEIITSDETPDDEAEGAPPAGLHREEMAAAAVWA